MNSFIGKLAPPTGEFTIDRSWYLFESSDEYFNIRSLTPDENEAEQDKRTVDDVLRFLYGFSGGTE